MRQESVRPIHNIVALPALALVLMSAISVQAQEARIDARLFENGVFRHAEAIGGRFEVISGPMLYQERDDEHYSRGYRPQSVVQLSGTLRREIYDLPPQRRAHGVFRQVTSMLTGAGFEGKYQCERQTCGEIAGWRLYLSDLIGGPEQTQYYYLASGAPQAGAEAPHVAVYINELDGQSRLLIDYVGPDGAGRSLATPASTHAAILFPKDSDYPTADSAKAIRAVSRLIAADDSEQVYRIVGHTDRDGGLLANICLSARRAQRIRKILVETFAVPAQRLVAYGLGPLTPNVAKVNSGEKAHDRRVEVFPAVTAVSTNSPQTALNAR